MSEKDTLWLYLFCNHNWPIDAIRLYLFPPILTPDFSQHMSECSHLCDYCLPSPGKLSADLRRFTPTPIIHFHRTKIAAWVKIQQAYLFQQGLWVLNWMESVNIHMPRQFSSPPQIVWWIKTKQKIKSGGFENNSSQDNVCKCTQKFKKQDQAWLSD